MPAASVPAEQLPEARGELYEKIPCSGMFRHESGSYHSSFQPHPLYWGTRNQDEIREALGDRNITLAEGEYPLLAGIMLMTTKGCRRKKEFIPWQDTHWRQEFHHW